MALWCEVAGALEAKRPKRGRPRWRRYLRALEFREGGQDRRQSSQAPGSQAQGSGAGNSIAATGMGWEVRRSGCSRKRSRRMSKVFHALIKLGSFHELAGATLRPRGMDDHAPCRMLARHTE